jgi:peptidoglycan/LPS O-acetylase OafA/YrhL
MHFQLMINRDRKMKLAQSDHINELQSVRGIACFMVMVGHCLVFYTTTPSFHMFASLFNGRAAVVIFFVLSGYVLTRSLRKAEFNRATFERFYVQRFFRIYPAMWAASLLGLWYIFVLHWQVPSDRVDLIASQFRPDRFDALHIIASFAGLTTFILPQLWTIFIEIVASVAMPFIAFVAFRRSNWFLPLLIAAVLLSFPFGKTIYHVTIYFMDFIVGAGLAMPGVASRLFRRAPAALLVALAFIAMAMEQWLPLDYWSPVAHVIETALAALIIGVLIGAEQRIAVLKSRFLLFVGDISYSTYLLHYAVMCIIAKVFTMLQLTAQVEVDTIILSLLLAVLTVAITMPLAWLSFIYIEQPGIQLGKAALLGLPALRLQRQKVGTR